MNLLLCSCVVVASTATAEQAAPSREVTEAAAEEKTLKGSEAARVPKVQAEEVEDEAGVKTFKFGAVEVEGRLKAPQIIYFLRRVRAEFRAGLLGHRSFLPELSDTRRSPALR